MPARQMIHMSIEKQKVERFHFLDVLRGISAVVIMFHHAFTSNIARLFNHLHMPVAGFYYSYVTHSAVELLFTLSGVVLLRPYMRKQRPLKFIEYYKRRIKRIYPPYLVALIMAALISLFMQVFPTWYNTGEGNNISVFHMYFDWIEILKESVIINFDGKYYNLAWWSLNLEMIFYLLAPFIVLTFPPVKRLTNINVMLMILFTLAASTALQLWLTAQYPGIYTHKMLVLNAYQFICYPMCFLCGVLIASRDFELNMGYTFMAMGFVLIVASYWFLPFTNSGYGLLHGGIIIMLFHRKSMQKALVNPLFVWMGERSYSIFLVHFSIFYLADNLAAHFTSHRGAAYGIISRGIGIPLALFGAMLLFHFVERKYARGLITGDIFWPWQIKKIKARLAEHNM